MAKGITVKKAAICSTLIATLLCTACGKETVQEETATSKSEITAVLTTESIVDTTTETSVTTEQLLEQTTETTTSSATETTTATDITAEETEAISPEIDTLAQMYAQKLMERIVNDKETKDEYSQFRPINGAEMGLQSEMALIDVDFDGTPELFAGICGTIGAGFYDVYTPTGETLGTDLYCCSDLSSGHIVDGIMYMFSGRNPNPGWVKLVEGTPSVMVLDWLNTEEAVNPVEVSTTDGTVKHFEKQSMDDIKALYRKYLDVDYDALSFAGVEPKYLCVSGSLRVSDPQNYTEQDIYNCLIPMLNDYATQQTT